MYKVKFHPQFQKSLKKLHRNDQKKFFKKLDKFIQDPFIKSFDTKKLAGTESSYRWRIGDFRVIYSLNSTKKNIYFWEIAYRGKIY